MNEDDERRAAFRDAWRQVRAGLQEGGDAGLASFEDVTARLAEVDDPWFDEVRATALLHAGNAHAAAGRDAEALRGFDALASGFGDREALKVRHLVAEGLVAKAQALQRLERTEEAVLLLDAARVAHRRLVPLDTRWSTHHVQQAASATLAKIDELLLLGRAEEALGAYAELSPHDVELVGAALGERLLIDVIWHAYALCDRGEHDHAARLPAILGRLLGPIEPTAAPEPAVVDESAIAALLSRTLGDRTWDELDERGADRDCARDARRAHALYDATAPVVAALVADLDEDAPVVLAATLLRGIADGYAFLSVDAELPQHMLDQVATRERAESAIAPELAEWSAAHGHELEGVADEPLRIEQKPGNPYDADGAGFTASFVRAIRLHELVTVALARPRGRAALGGPRLRWTAAEQVRVSQGWMFNQERHDPDTSLAALLMLFVAQSMYANTCAPSWFPGADYLREAIAQAGVAELLRERTDGLPEWLTSG